MNLSLHESMLGQQEMLCPACDSNYTHVQRVEVFARREDEKQGVHVVVDMVDCYQMHGDARVSVDSKMSGNPSARRGSVSLSILCELCGNVSVIDFVQHKGSTEVHATKIGQGISS